MKEFLLVIACLGFVLEAGVSAKGQTISNSDIPGIIFTTEFRTNPPQRLFIARVDLTNPRLHLRVASGGNDPDGPGKWETTLMEPTQIARREHFSLVVNGDFFQAKNIQDAEGARSRYRAGQWARTEGPAMTGGQTWSTSPQPRPCLVIHKDGRVTIDTLAIPGPDDRDVVGGGPILVRHGAIVLSPAIPQKKFDRSNPRTAVGLDASAHLILLVVDGRKPGVASGMTLNELALEMQHLGCKDAINLDGGGSSVMAVRDASTGAMKILNQPTDGHERAVADVLGIREN